MPVVPAVRRLSQEDGEFEASLGYIEKLCFKNSHNLSWVPVAHTCNPSYSGSRDQEDCGSKPVQAKSSQDHISKNPSQK
jgi:hypothetical protein